MHLCMYALINCSVFIACPDSWSRQQTVYDLFSYSYNIRKSFIQHSDVAIIIIIIIIIQNSQRFSWFQTVRVTDQALLIHCSAKNVRPMRHVLSITAFCMRLLLLLLLLLLDSVVRVASYYGLNGTGFATRWGRDIPYPSKPALGPPSFLYKGYRVSLLPSVSEVKKQ